MSFALTMFCALKIDKELILQRSELFEHGPRLKRAKHDLTSCGSICHSPQENGLFESCLVLHGLAAGFSGQKLIATELQSNRSLLPEQEA